VHLKNFTTAEELDTALQTSPIVTRARWREISGWWCTTEDLRLMEWGQRQVRWRFDEWFNSSDATSCDILSDVQSSEDQTLHCTSIFAHNGEVDETQKVYVYRGTLTSSYNSLDRAVIASVLSSPW